MKSFTGLGFGLLNPDSGLGFCFWNIFSGLGFGFLNPDSGLGFCFGKSFSGLGFWFLKPNSGLQFHIVVDYVRVKDMFKQYFFPRYHRDSGEDLFLYSGLKVCPRFLTTDSTTHRKSPCHTAF